MTSTPTIAGCSARARCNAAPFGRFLAPSPLRPRRFLDWAEDSHDRPWSCRFEDEPVTDDPQIREALARERQLPEW